MIGYLKAKHKGAQVMHGPGFSAAEAGSAGEGVLQRALQKIQTKRAESQAATEAETAQSEEEEEQFDPTARNMIGLGNLFLGGL
jgi:hypothetical protein